MYRRITICFFILMISSSLAFAAATDYLILQNIGPYNLFTGIPGRVFSGPPSKFSQTNTAGILTAAGHFSEGDVSYKASYTEPSSKWPFIDVEITQHSSSDSDIWLRHELDADFRNYYGIPGKSYAVVPVNGNIVLEFGSSGWAYRWLCENRVINIEYQDAQMTKPEPLEVVKTYLAKHPSTLQGMTLTQLRNTESKITWIKDEMERRLWLCDKWFSQTELMRTDQKKVLQEQVRSMKVFLDYREKYFGISAKDEKNLLEQYLDQNDSTNIQAKLKAYKDWWAAHKGDSINL